MKSATFSIGKNQITIETGEIAKLANSAVIVKQKDTVILATVVASEESAAHLGFFPLTVEYREKTAAAGKVPGGFIKRETRPQDHEILASRIIDRSIRPLFPEHFLCETQVMVYVMSYDPEADPEPLAILGASAALHISEIPWNGPVGGVRIIKKGSDYTLLPTFAERENSDLEIIATFSQEGLIMAEGVANQATEKEVLKGLELAQNSIKEFFTVVEGWRKELGIEKRVCENPNVIPEEMKIDVHSEVKDKLLEAVLTPQKKERSKNIKSVLKEAKKNFAEKYPEEEAKVSNILEDLHYNLVRDYMVKEKKRIDGRDFKKVRSISGRTHWLPRVHGSAIFTRGETQALVSCTLGTPDDQQMVEYLSGENKERFLLHYNFPSFSVGEVRPLRGPGRREIGHGNLALRALKCVLPPVEEFVYTIRLVSDISESNGSSSMATVCGGCLAMMDTGVPIKEMVAGIAMGLIQQNNETIIISDIMGDEDHLGDMDFKVTGTTNGVTALQIDNKIGSLSFAVLEEALDQAKEGRLHILDEMKKILPETRPELSPSAPRIVTTKIKKDRIRDLIGPGGKYVQEIQKKCSVQININSDTGDVLVYAKNMEDCEIALREINLLVGDPDIGKVYRGIVTSTKDFGAFVKFFGSTEGLVHISELAKGRVAKVTDVVREGDTLLVKVLGIERGKIRLSRKEALNSDESDVAN